MLEFFMQFYMISFLLFGIQTVLTKLQEEFCCLVQEMCTFWSEFKLLLPSELPFISVGICSRCEFSILCSAVDFRLWLGALIH